MGQGSIRETVLLGLTTITTTGSGPDIIVPQSYQAATITCNLSTVSGTSPTLLCFIQRKLGQAAATDLSGGFPTGTGIYDDLLCFTTLTTSSTIQIANLVAGEMVGTANASTLTTVDWANAVQNIGFGKARIGPLSGTWKVGYVLGGTSPSFAFSVTAQFIPFGT